MRVIKNLVGMVGKLTAGFSALVLAGSAFAAGGLPTMEEPSRGSGSGIRETVQNHAYDFVIFAGLGIAALVFCGVSWYAYQVFAQVQDGKKKWGDFGLVVIVGVMLIILIIWLLTKAAEIL